MRLLSLRENTNKSLHQGHFQDEWQTEEEHSIQEFSEREGSNCSVCSGNYELSFLAIS